LHFDPASQRPTFGSSLASVNTHTMKIRVNVNIKTSSVADVTLDLVTRPSDTVASVKEKVAGAQLIPYPELELSFDGVALADESKLSTCGVEEGSSLNFKISATETTLVQQLTELLKARDLSADELGLLYCYKHGANISQALKLIGFEMTLQDFVSKQKALSMENGLVTIVRTDTSLKPFSVVDEIVQILKESDSDAMEIKELCAKFVQKFGVALSSIIGTRPGEFLAKEKATFVLHGRHGSRVSLQGAHMKRASTPTIAGDGMDSPPGFANEGPPGLIGGPAPLGLSDEEAPPGLSGESSSESEECPPSVYNQQFEELHTRIRSDSAKVTMRVNELVGALSDTSFLVIGHVVIGGPIGKGTAISGPATAEVVLFLLGLAVTGHEAWYAPLLKALAASLADDEDFLVEHGIESLYVQDNFIKISLDERSPIVVNLYISSVFESYQNTLQVIGQQGPDVRSFYAPSLAKERTQFVSRQPSTVKMTIRLLKWWRDQQQWSGPISRPSDELLELAAIYSAVRTKPIDQNEAMANLMSLLSRFDEMRVVWSNYYSKSDVSAPLLQQRPLLMDPTNPYVNVANAQNFDATELMTLASTTHFFW